nr:hypothetical protein [uncultured Trichococcus sp.]
MKIYKFKFTCDEYIYEISADFQVEAKTRKEADEKVMELLYEAYPIAETNNTARVKLIGIDCVGESQEFIEGLSHMNEYALSFSHIENIQQTDPTLFEFAYDVYQRTKYMLEEINADCGKNEEVEGWTEKSQTNAG